MFDDISNGAFGDFQQATQIATQMVTKLGMSDLGPMQNENNVFYNDETVKSEIKKIINKCMEEAKKIMKENKDLLNKIANTLLEQETIVKEQLEQIVNQNNLNI
ncbi:MAG: ATP-dependent zinc metalloprotease FtsH [Candidatus Phytoplasma pruni]